MTKAEFIQCYMPLQEGLYKVAYYILETEADAQDAVQDLYVKLWNSLDSLDTVRNPKAYCVTLIRNICLDRVRRASHSRGEELPDLASDSPDSLSAMQARESLARVTAAIGELPRKQRMVLQMKVFEDLSYEEIEERTGMNYLTLRVYLSQARRKLRNVL